MNALLDPHASDRNRPEQLPLSTSRCLSARKCILVADDDAIVRAALSAVLESEGYAVDEAQNGFEAVSHAIAHPPDLVLLDLNMPRLDGWDAFVQLDRLAPPVPIIVITARPHQYKEAVRLGVDAFMEKPLQIPALLRAIRRLVTEAPEQRVTRIASRTFVTWLLDASLVDRELSTS